MTVLTFRDVSKISSVNPANDKLSSFHFQATLIGVAEPSTIEILNSISSANNQPLPPRAESRNHQESKIKSNQFQLLVSILSVKEKKMPSCTVNYTVSKLIYREISTINLLKFRMYAQTSNSRLVLFYDLI